MLNDYQLHKIIFERHKHEQMIKFATITCLLVITESPYLHILLITICYGISSDV
jgi:hypothetical protein